MTSLTLITAGLAVPAAAQSVTIVSPHPGEHVDFAGYYHVRWTAQSVPADARFVAWYAHASGGERVICHAESTARACGWFEPDSLATNVYVDIRDTAGGVLARAESGTIQIGPTNLPAGWEHYDVGDVGRSGGAWGHDETTIRVRGAGADIWGTTDAFHGLEWILGRHDDFNLTATVSQLEGTHRWTKVGVMLRDSRRPESRHHFVFASKEMGLAYQRRLVTGGESLHTSISPSSALPVTIQVMRRDNVVVMDFRQGDGPWQRAAEFTTPQSFVPLLAVTSHDLNVLAEGLFTGLSAHPMWDETVRIFAPEADLTAGVPYTIEWTHQQLVNTATVSYSTDRGATWTAIPECTSVTGSSCVWQNPGPASEDARLRVVIDDPNDRTAWNVSFPFRIREAGGSALPQGWTNTDVGSVGASGSASFDATARQFTVEGSGADIWDTADEFHFAYRQVTRWGQEDDFDVTARVVSVENVHRWTKAGIMVRSGTGASAQHAFLLATPGTEKGVAFQHRPTAGALSRHTAGPALGPPVWLKLLVRGGDVHAYYRQRTTDPWTFIGTAFVHFSGSTFEVGLAVSSHRDGTLASATFDNVSIERRISLQGEDIGAVGVPGSGGVEGVTVTIDGSGSDIWNTADAFRYHWMQLSSIGNRAGLSARVWSVENTHRWAKAGVMFREDASPGSRHVMLIVSAERGIAMQYRDAAGGISRDVAIVPGAGPVWLRLERYGSLFIGEASTDGLNWTEVGRIVLPMSDLVMGGLAVTSHNNNTLATAIFDDLVVHDDYSLPQPGGNRP